MSCNPTGGKTDNKSQAFSQGTYGYDLEFLTDNNTEVLELTSPDSTRRLLLVPDWQGRVMTTTSAGLAGKSFGWMNYDLISSKEKDPQFNPYGGEERFWLGPEGGPFSLYFQKGDEQVYTNWKVPEFIDTRPFDIKSFNREEAVFSARTRLANASGHVLQIDVVRRVKLLDRDDIASEIDLELSKDLEFVAYQSENMIKNTGDSAWTPDHGFVSIWMLCMFNPSPEGVVFIPVKEQGKTKNEILTDDYFGKVPEKRLKLIDGLVYFKVDGKLRSKIGISPVAATSLAAGYDPVNQVLTIVRFSGPKPSQPYVNSVWGEQENPLKGDAINAYNDGPVDGNIMGPFYEIETSSPAALLTPGEELRHVQSVFHFTGDEKALEDITLKLFDLTIKEINDVFSNNPE